MKANVRVVLVALGLLCASARAGTINAFLTEASGSNGDADTIGVKLSIVDTTGGVQVTATVTDIASASLGEGDILALWFDVSSTANLALVNYSDPYDPANLNVTGFAKGHNTIGSAPFGGGGPNIGGLSGSFSASTKYDIAIRLGTDGMSSDYYPSASFKLTNLSVADFGSLTNRFAARVTSVGSDHQDSGKYAGFLDLKTSNLVTAVPTPTAAMGGLALFGFLSLCRKRIF
jgi:hypothetical protein